MTSQFRLGNNFLSKKLKNILEMIEFCLWFILILTYIFVEKLKMKCSLNEASIVKKIQQAINIHPNLIFQYFI